MHTEFLLDYLKSNDNIVNWYLKTCEKEDKLPSCTGFISKVGFDWSAYSYSRQTITKYLKERQKGG